MAWKIEAITKNHKNQCGSFNCGVDQLNTFLQRAARPNAEKGISKTFLACDTVSGEVQGYFTVSAGTVRFDTVPDHQELKLPQYPIPTVHIGRFAIASAHQRKGLGGTLLVEALMRAANTSQQIGVYAVDLIAFNDDAKRFYERHGFVRMLDDPNHLFLPIETARRIAAAAVGGHPPN